MQNLVTQIQPLVKIRRSRTLPVSGTVLVRLGQKVSPTEVLAESMIPTRHMLIDVFRALGVKNSMEANRLIDRKIGDSLEKHDIIAETGGLFSRVVRAPMPGKIVSIKNGQVLLEVDSCRVVVQSGYSGKVVEILKDHGAVVETSGMLIQGVWGNGLIGFGPLLADTRLIDLELISSSLSITSRGAVLAASCCEKEESLITAGSLPLGGLILGSMNPRLIPCALEQKYPIILIEGFGKAGINEFARKLLIESSQKEISLNAVKWEHFYGTRPEMNIAAPSEADQASESVECAEGQTIRVHTAPYMGQIGTITAINSAKTTLANGLKTVTASVLLRNNEKAVIPFSNFDIIEKK